MLAAGPLPAESYERIRARWRAVAEQSWVERSDANRRSAVARPRAGSGRNAGHCCTRATSAEYMRESPAYDKRGLSNHADRIRLRKDASPMHDAYTSFSTSVGRISCVSQGGGRGWGAGGQIPP